MELWREDSVGESSMTHYAVLRVAEDATFAQIRASYLSSLLALHPDKQNQETSASSDFLRLQEAWHVLKEPQSRSTYDRHLASSRLFLNNVLADEVPLQDMNRELFEADAAYTFPCRCGDFFTLLSQEVDEWQDVDHCGNSVHPRATKSENTNHLEKLQLPFVAEKISNDQDLHHLREQTRFWIVVAP
ncbi:hypothetical protein L7F22_053245 [Adiantum nelumboides]|nr:hypothetical protein [Adiantum nelumboides]